MFTAHALVSMSHHWLQSADKSNCVRAFLLDFSKAFVRMDRQVVCKKMMNMNIDITLRRWEQSFLSNRICYPIKLRKIQRWCSARHGPQSNFVSNHG
jgi:hypothetical protein